MLGCSLWAVVFVRFFVSNILYFVQNMIIWYPLTNQVKCTAHITPTFKLLHFTQRRPSTHQLIKKHYGFTIPHTETSGQ